MKEAEERLGWRVRIAGPLLWYALTGCAVLLAIWSINDAIPVAGIARYAAALPFLLLFSVAFASMLPRVTRASLTGDRPPDGEPLYAGERVLGTVCLLGALFAPFVVNPIVHHAVYPALGYSYCEPLTTYQRPFRFPTYAYVADPALCPE